MWNALRLVLRLKLTNCPTFSVRLISQPFSQPYLYLRSTWRRAFTELRSNFWKLLCTSRNFDGVWVRIYIHTAVLQTPSDSPIPTDSYFSVGVHISAYIHYHISYNIMFHNKLKQKKELNRIKINTKNHIQESLYICSDGTRWNKREEGNLP